VLPSEAPVRADATITRASNLGVDASADGRVVIDLLGDLWVVPGGGGEARQLTHDLKTVQRPRWSPDSQRIAYQASAGRSQGIWLFDFVSGTSRKLSTHPTLDVHPDWHPDGERIVFASAAANDGFDLWEVDIATGLQWRISDREGDETEPAWSADGRSLVYISRHNQSWSLILRQHGQREEVLLRSGSALSAPTFRPDGSLITFFRNEPGGWSLDMIILSRPRLIRTYANNEKFAATPIRWFDRQRMVYSANNGLRQKSFGTWLSKALPFHATVHAAPRTVDDRVRRPLEWSNEPRGEFIIHAARLFDGVQTDYLFHQDIAIRGGRIVGVAGHTDHGGSIVIDMGDLTLLPGFIDADARLANALAPSHGPDLLTMGITTIVATHPNSSQLNALWSAKTVPGPRFLDASLWPLAPMTRPEVEASAAITSSRGTGQTSGIALPTQFRALNFAGLSPVQSLRAIGVNAAAALLTDPYLGRIAIGASADLVFVDGDPLRDVHDALNVVAVVRNGRFFSLSGLIDRSKAAEIVE
jgi:hypothetical protein